MGMILGLLVAVLLPCVLGQAQEDGSGCFGASSVAGAAIGAFAAALIIVAIAIYLRRLYWKSKKGKHLVFSTDPESVKDEFAFDNPGFRQEERAWQYDAPTLPMGGKGAPGGGGGKGAPGGGKGASGGGKTHALHAEFTKPEQSKDDMHLQRAEIRRVQLWARDFTGLGLRCGGGARDGVHVHSVLRSGPAAAAQLHPGDKIKSIKIEFSGTPLEDAVAILSLASPYPVELEVVAGGRASGAGRAARHPLLRRAGSTGDVTALEKEGKLLHPQKSPIISHSNHSTLETKQGKGGIKKIITEKIITTTTLERNKKETEKKDVPSTTLERENEKNTKLANKSRHSDVIPASNKPDKNKSRHSTGTDMHVIQPENNIPHNIEYAEVQKREIDPKRGMKFGIRVLPPNIPDDGVLKQKNFENGVIATRDEIDKSETPRIAPTPQVRHENETEIKKPVVAKRREKIAPPIPNARVKVTEDNHKSQDSSKTSESSFTTFARSDLNSSGIKRDENGIPQELPQHMLEAANAARNNRKSLEMTFDKEIIKKPDHKKDEAPKPKKSKGKAPSPPAEKVKMDDIVLEELKHVSDFLNNEKLHSSQLHDTFTGTDHKSGSHNITSSTFNTSTPKGIKTKNTLQDSINFSQDDIDDIVSRPFRKQSDSLNNYFEETKSNISSNQDVRSVLSFTHSDNSDKGSTTIELNNSDITIHSSPMKNTSNSESYDASITDENERKAASLGDLSRFELRAKTSKPSTGTLERAQSLDISADDAEIKESTLSPKKRKAMSVVETTFFDSGTEDILPDMIHSNKILTKSKEPRLSLNIAKTSAMEGLNTFQRNRLKKASEFGNLEDAIVKGSNSSVDSERNDLHESPKHTIREPGEAHESSDHLAKRIMDENMKVHMKLVQEFAKSTSEGSNNNSLDSSQNKDVSNDVSPTKYEDSISMSYDTNIPDDLKVSRNTYVNSLERPKSEMMKKLLAKNPILNVHIDPRHKIEASTSKEPTTPMTDALKSALHQPDIVNFNLKSKSSELKTLDHDDFVSNIRVGSNNNNLQHNKKPSLETFTSGWSHRETDNHNKNVITVSTNDKQEPDEKRTSYTKSIEIGEPTLGLIPDVIGGIERRNDEVEGRTIYMEPGNVSLTMSEEPVQKTVSVSVAEDDYGNKIITQNVEKISHKYLTAKSEPALQVEQISFGISRNPADIAEIKLQEGEVKEIDKKILDEIRRQNPNMHFTTEDPSFTNIETIIVKTKLDEDQAKVLLEKIKNDPDFMARKSPVEPSQMGITITHDLEDIQNKIHDTVEVTKTKYSVNPVIIADNQACKKIERNKEPEVQMDHITEIQVVTPRSEKMVKQKSDLSQDKISNRQRAPQFEEPPLSYELDIDLLNDFIAYERLHSAKQLSESKKRERTNQNENEPKKRHSDFDLPRNSHIKFRTATYESPKGTIVTSTDIENRRLSQRDQMQLRAASEAASQKPALAVKPSGIPSKVVDKPKPGTGANVSSKIPVFTSQRSLSQESMSERGFSLPRPSDPQLGGGGANISVTSIKSSSRSPSGGRL